MVSQHTEFLTLFTEAPSRDILSRPAPTMCEVIRTTQLEVARECPLRHKESIFLGIIKSLGLPLSSSLFLLVILPSSYNGCQTSTTSAVNALSTYNPTTRCVEYTNQLENRASGASFIAAIHNVSKFVTVPGQVNRDQER